MNGERHARLTPSSKLNVSNAINDHSCIAQERKKKTIKMVSIEFSLHERFRAKTMKTSKRVFRNSFNASAALIAHIQLVWPVRRLQFSECIEFRVESNEMPVSVWSVPPECGTMESGPSDNFETINLLLSDALSYIRISYAATRNRT